MKTRLIALTMILAAVIIISAFQSDQKTVISANNDLQEDATFFFQNYVPGDPEEPQHNLCTDGVQSGTMCREFSSISECCYWMCYCEGHHPEWYSNWTIDGIAASIYCDCPIAK